jgi:hypothetical protein
MSTIENLRSPRLLAFIARIAEEEEVATVADRTWLGSRPIVLDSPTHWHITIPPFLTPSGEIRGGFCVSRTEVLELLGAIEQTRACCVHQPPIVDSKMGEDVEPAEIMAMCEGILRAARPSCGVEC